MTVTAPLCLSCGGTVAWYPQVGAWRHSWVREGTQPHPVVLERHDGAVETGAAYIAEVVESDIDTGRRIEAERTEVEAKGRAMREALGVIEPYEPERPVPRAEPEIEMRLGTTPEGAEFAYPWLVEPTWINSDGSAVRVTPGTGAKSAAAKSDRLDVHPAPIETARPAFDSEIPTSAKRLPGLMADHGWADVAVLFSRGYRPDVHRRVSHTRAVDVVVVKGTRWRNRERLVACWEDGRYDVAWRLTPGQLPQPLASAQVRKVIAAEVIVCSTCDEPAHTHPMTDTSPACFDLEVAI